MSIPGSSYDRTIFEQQKKREAAKAAKEKSDLEFRQRTEKRELFNSIISSLALLIALGSLIVSIVALVR